MRFPNKVTTYQESILALFPEILFLVMQCDTSVLDVFENLKKRRWRHLSTSTYIQALDCLYYLGKIELKENRIHYVGRN